VFDVYVGGIRAGVVSISGEERDGRYAAAGRLESVGLVGAFRKVQYEAEVRGRLSGRKFGPRTYSETYRNGRDTEEKEIDYRKGFPRVRPKDAIGGRLDPKEQDGTIDPLTAIWSVLRDVSEGDACRFSGDLYDGKRRSRVALGEPEQSGSGIACDGEYRRVAGYDDDDMEKPSFPFRVAYGPAGDGRWQVERIDMESILGRGAIVRR
jgi:hypothetical protein